MSNPIDLSLYTKAKRKYLKNAKACCVYVIGERPEGPLKVGIAGDVVQRFRQLYDASAVKLQLWSVLWTPGRPIATGIEAYTHSILRDAGRSLKGEWFNADVQSVNDAINWVSKQMYPTAKLISHTAMFKKLDKAGFVKPPKPVDIRDEQEYNKLLEMFRSASGVSEDLTPTFTDVKQVLDWRTQIHADKAWSAEVKARRIASES